MLLPAAHPHVTPNMVSAERQQIIETNKSLRLIKNVRLVAYAYYPAGLTPILPTHSESHPKKKGLTNTLLLLPSPVHRNSNPFSTRES